MARRDRQRLDRSTAPDKPPMLPCVDRRGEASVGVSAGNAPVADARVMEGVVERKNLVAALARVKTNGGSPGIDGLRVDAWPGYLRIHWPGIRASLLAGTYRPSPGKRVESPKPGGGVRKLGIPTVLDRFIPQALLQVLQPAWDKTFSERSDGLRPGPSAQQAVARAQQSLAEG
jgi:RNA-directed DNA polymerase